MVPILQKKSKKVSVTISNFPKVTELVMLAGQTEAV